MPSAAATSSWLSWLSATSKTTSRSPRGNAARALASCGRLGVQPPGHIPVDVAHVPVIDGSEHIRFPLEPGGKLRVGHLVAHVGGQVPVSVMRRLSWGEVVNCHPYFAGSPNRFPIAGTRLARPLLTQVSPAVRNLGCPSLMMQAARTSSGGERAGEYPHVVDPGKNPQIPKLGGARELAPCLLAERPARGCAGSADAWRPGRGRRSWRRGSR